MRRYAREGEREREAERRGEREPPELLSILDQVLLERGVSSDRHETIVPRGDRLSSRGDLPCPLLLSSVGHQPTAPHLGQSHDVSAHFEGARHLWVSERELPPLGPRAWARLSILGDSHCDRRRWGGALLTRSLQSLRDGRLLALHELWASEPTAEEGVGSLTWSLCRIWSKISSRWARADFFGTPLTPTPDFTLTLTKGVELGTASTGRWGRGLCPDSSSNALLFPLLVFAGEWRLLTEGCSR
jgi:hypothetical protein